MRSSLECQVTSGEARPCRELGEQWATETSLPLGHDQQKLPSRLERFHPLITTRLEGIDTAANSMTCRVGIVLQDHLARLVERERQTSQPADETPQQTRRNDRLMLVTRSFVFVLVNPLDRIADLQTVVPHRGAIGRACRIPLGCFWLQTLWHVEILLGLREKPRRGEAFIGQNESWDSR